MYNVFRTEGGRLIRECYNELLWIEPWGANSLRVRGTPLACMQAEDWALLPQEGPEPEIIIEGETASVRNGKIRADISAGGKITFYNQKNEMLLREYVRCRFKIKSYTKK
jgi:alpha-D-xyloside xylohydrolase